MDKALEITKLDRRSKISDYSNDEYSNLKDCLISLHNDTLYGACLCKEWHELFHKEYTYYDSTLDVQILKNDFFDYPKSCHTSYIYIFFLFV